MHKAQQQMLQETVKKCIDIHDSTKNIKKHSADRSELTKQLKETLQEADDFVDGLIESMNDELEWREVTKSSPKRMKYDLMRKLVEGLEEDIQNTDNLYETIRLKQ